VHSLRGRAGAAATYQGVGGANTRKAHAQHKKRRESSPLSYQDTSCEEELAGTGLTEL
jgi:hypothetical protein